MTAALTQLVRTEPRRDRYGRPLVVLPGATDPQPLTRVTTIAETLGDRFALEQWSKRNVILGIAARRDLYAHACSLTPADRNDLNDIAEQAEKAAGSSAAATTGTALHRFVERINAGETIEVPAPWDADVAAYQATLATHGIEILPEFLERFVVNVAMGAAGTADQLVRHQGGLRVADLKTGRHLDFAKIAIQLALYANAETFYDPATDTHTPMPEVDTTTGIVVHLLAGEATCDIYEVDLTEGLRWAQVALDVRAWRKTNPATRLEAPTLAAAPSAEDPVVDVERADWLRARLTTIRDEHPAAMARLASVWPAGIPGFKSDHQHTPDELARIAKVLAQVETSEQVPFPPTNLPPSRAELIARLRALPADLLEEVTASAKAAGVTHLLGRQVTVAQLETLDELLGPAEAISEERAARAAVALTKLAPVLDLMVDADLDRYGDVRAAAGLGGRPLESLTEPELRNLVAICDAADAGAIDIEIGAATVNQAALDALCDAHGKGTVRDIAKTYADELGATKPRAAADLSSAPLLFALTRGHLTTQGDTS